MSIGNEAAVQQQNKNDGQSQPFTDYAPHVFRYLRTEIYDISDRKYIESVRPSTNESESQSIVAKFSEGRSGVVLCLFLNFFFLFRNFAVLTVTYTRMHKQNIHGNKTYDAKK